MTNQTKAVLASVATAVGIGILLAAMIFSQVVKWILFGLVLGACGMLIVLILSYGLYSAWKDHFDKKAT